MLTSLSTQSVAVTEELDSYLSQCFCLKGSHIMLRIMREFLCSTLFVPTDH